MNGFINLIKGALVGVANIVAGLSGATVAILCKVYDNMLDMFSNVLQHPIKTIKKHYALLLGIILGIVLGSFALKKIYETAPFPITLFCAGIVFFGLIPFSKELDFGKRKVLNTLFLIIPFAIMVYLPFAADVTKIELVLDFKYCLVLFALGLLASTSMMLPGLSGSMMLMVVGFYDEILGLLTNLISSFIHFKFDNLGVNIVLLLVFLLGCLVGLVGSSKILKILFNKKEREMNLITFGLISGSFVAMIIKAVQLNNALNLNLTSNIIMIASGLLLIVIGFFIGLAVYLFTKKEDENMVELNKEKCLSLVDKYFDEYKSLLKNLVSYASVLEEYKEGSNEPFGKENREVLEYILDYAKKDGFSVLNQDNYAGHIEFGDSKDILGILAHLDVVPVKGQKWDHDPFDMVETDTKLIGRGVNDDKGPLAASYIALKILKDLGFKPSKKIRLIMGCDEESGSRCLEHYFKYNEMPEVGYSPDACFPCINGEKAGAHFDIKGKLAKDSIITSLLAGERYNIVPGEARMKLKKDYTKEFLKFLKDKGYNGEVKDNTYIAYGLSAHAMTPEKGLNAAFILFEFLSTITDEEIVKFVNKYVIYDPTGKKFGNDITVDEMGSLTENVGIVKILNNEIFLGFDCRVPKEGHDKVMKENIEKALKEYKDIYLAEFNMGEIHYVSSNSNLVQTLVKSYQMFTKDYDHNAYTIGGGTYAKFIKNAVAFGPQFIDDEDVDHQANEFILKEKYKKVIAIYIMAIYELAK